LTLEIAAKKPTPDNPPHCHISETLGSSNSLLAERTGEGPTARMVKPEGHADSLTMAGENEATSLDDLDERPSAVSGMPRCTVVQLHPLPPHLSPSA